MITQELRAAACMIKSIQKDSAELDTEFCLMPLLQSITQAHVSFRDIDTAANLWFIKKEEPSYYTFQVSCCNRGSNELEYMVHHVGQFGITLICQSLMLIGE